MKLIIVIVLFSTTFLYSNKLSEHYFQKACQRSIAQGCYNLALSLIKKNPYKTDNLKAVLALNKACKLRLGSACYKLATMYEKGKGAKRNKAKAKLYYKKACKYKHSRGCKKYRQIL